MSVAIRTAVRIQDQDDAPTLGAGQDGYALTWDNASGAFVATALFTGGLLATGATTGATSQAQAFTNGIIGPSWKPSVNSTTALQLQNAAGTSVLNVDTTNGNVGIGTTSPGVPFDVSAPAAVGNYIRAISIGTSGYGASVILNSTSITSGRSYSFSSTGNADVGGAGLFSITDNSAAGASRLVINSSGNVGIGTAAPATLLHANLVSAATNAVTNVVTIGHDTSGTAAAGFGAGLLFQLESSTTAAQNAARIQALWNDATHATRKADLVLSAYDTAEREGLRIRGAGSAPAIGFYGVSPIERATLATGAGASVDDVITALQNLGLVKQS